MSLPATSAPIAPRLLKGAIIGADKFNPLASVVVFQYNPETVTRTLRARMSGSGAGSSDAGARGESARLSGPPSESIRVVIEVDAADQVGGAAAGVGVHAPIAALEMLLYPKTIQVIRDAVTAQAGVLSIVAPEAPTTLFIWGPTRVLPVRISEMTITEEAHDNLLNPVRAKVELSMNVLSYNDVPLASFSGALFMANQVIKEVLATTNTAWSIANAGQSLKLF